MSAVPPPPPGAAPASRPPGPLFARPARRRNGHRILDGLEAVRRARARYPDARATREDRRRLSHGVDYALHGLGDPLAVRRDEHRLLVATQMLSYLRVCDRIVRGYEQCAGLRRYLHKTLLQFEHPWIRDLSEAYPVRTLIGAQFASDVAVTPGPAPAQARFQTLEVNFGAVGRIAEGARAQAAFPGTPFPASAREVMAHMLASLDAYYYHACGILGIAPKPLAARRLVLVENDGWYLGPVCIAEAFARLGVPVVVAPREALRYDPDANRLYLQTAAGPEPVDQVFLDFGYVEDLPATPEAGAPTAGRQPPGAAITRALANRAVVAESCVLVQTVLGAKTTQALIDHLVRHPAHPFVAQLGIERTDLRSLEGMAPPTHQWGPAYFAARGINGFRVREYLAQAGLVAKATAGGFYGGRGVYLLAGPAAVRRRFWAAVRRTLWQALARFQERAGPAALIRFLRIAVVGPAAVAELRQHLDLQTGGAVAGTRRGRHLAQVCQALRVPRPRDAPAAEASGLRSGGAAGGAGGLSDAEEARLQALHHALHPHAAPAKDPPELLVADVDALLTELCWALRRVVDGPGPGAGAPAAELRQRCYERMATRLFLPYVLQEHVPADWRVDGEPIELRVAGTVGQEVDEFCAVVTASRKGVGDEPPKVIYPITAPAAPPPRDRDVDGR